MPVGETFSTPCPSAHILRSSCRYAETEAALPKDKPVDSQAAFREAVDAAERVHFRETCAFVERAILITVGATVTVLAGFLSQVWGSAGVPFRTELAQHLNSFGLLFLACFCLPFLRLFSLRPALAELRWPVTIFLAWAVGALAAACNYVWLLKHLGATILRHAVIVTPAG